ncbi:MAG: hypothetical protein H0V67_08215 [Geodermatophilaceae bacterium]|nr:hypothetical protein [Geodermatophilaceae bacterium]
MTVVDWLRQNLAEAGMPNMPIEVWEVGYGWDTPETYDEVAHAEDTVKLLATAAGEGSRRVVYVRYGYKEGRMPSMMSPTGTMRPAALAYRTTTRLLAGVTQAERFTFENPAAWGYRFTRDGRDTYVLWATAPVTVSLVAGDQPVTITDRQGNTSTGNSGSLALGVSPIFVQID